jgi:phenylacetic acid degradation operon negative regulatory protein
MSPPDRDRSAHESESPESPPTAGRGRRTQLLLFTIFGDYWFDRDVTIPSAALVALLDELGVGKAAARAALSRLTRRGLLEGAKVGRTTSYRVAPHLRQTRRARAREIARLGESEADLGGRDDGRAPWDGRWTCVMFSVPEDERDRRERVRRHLRMLGFGLVHDGVWISARPAARQAREALVEHRVERFTILVDAQVFGDQGIDPVAVWNLQAVRAGYDALLDHLDRVAPHLRAGTVSPADALVARTDLMAQWLDLVAQDPRLPDGLLPDTWPAARARAQFLEVYDGLGPAAATHVQAIVEPFSSEVAAAVRPHRLGDLAGADLGPPGSHGQPLGRASG